MCVVLCSPVSHMCNAPVHDSHGDKTKQHVGPVKVFTKSMRLIEQTPSAVQAKDDVVYKLLISCSHPYLISIGGIVKEI